MALLLRQSTAKVISFGPFTDKTDGVTEETGLVSALDHGTTGIKLSKNGGALTIRHATVTATTYDALGHYRVTLDTTDTDTVGTLRVAFNEAATCLPVWETFQVLEEAVYDALFAASSAGYQVPIWAAANSTVALSATTVATVTTVNGLAANAVNASALAADAVAEIQSGLATSASIGSGGAALTTIPWNPAWDAEVQSEVEDGLRVNNLDHLMAVTVTGADVADNSALAKLVSKSATADWDTYVNTTDSHEAIRDNMGTAQTGDSFARIGAAGAGLTAVPWNPAWDAEVQSEAQDAIEVNHLDHLLAADYDPASKPGVTTALLNELIESNAGVSRYTAAALAQAPSGGGGVADWTADERTALRTILGIPASGTTPEVPSAGALKIIDDLVDTEVQTLLGLLDTEIGTLLAAAAAIQAKTDNLPASPAAVGSAMTLATDAVSAAALSAAAVDKILDDAVEGSITLRQALRAVLTLFGGLSSRSGSTIYLRDILNTKNRIAVTTTSGDRTAITYDLT